MPFDQSAKVCGVYSTRIEKDGPQVRGGFRPEVLHAAKVYQPDAGIVVEEVVAPVWIGVKRLDLQHLKIEQLEEMRARFIPQFLRRPLSEKVVEVQSGHQGHRQHFVR